jgi:hypothetical protein
MVATMLIKVISIVFCSCAVWFISSGVRGDSGGADRYSLTGLDRDLRANRHALYTRSGHINDGHKSLATRGVWGGDVCGISAAPARRSASTLE